MSEIQLRTGLPPVICLMGPTAIGKSAVAVRLAQQLDCEIISVDSMQVYRGMDIGTAKPNDQQQGGITHHLIDILDPAQVYSTGQFRQQAIELMAEIIERGKTPLLVGGTMLYFKALFAGLAQLPTANKALRAELEQQAVEIGWQAMHAELARVDPEAGRRIHPNDPQRIQRALEVYRLSGQSLSALMKHNTQASLPYEFIKLALVPEDRSHLHATIRLRFNTMIEQGLIQETSVLYAREDLNSKVPAIRAVGYRQVWAYLDQQLDSTEMVERAVIATRQLAKRQLTWLRSIELTKQYQLRDTAFCSEILTDLSAVLRL
ncbi:MAG: tRNA (adenosine(37)-N6)-dimethylallyltransferase MiaA [Methylococcales bacterium]